METCSGFQAELRMCTRTRAPPPRQHLATGFQHKRNSSGHCGINELRWAGCSGMAIIIKGQTPILDGALWGHKEVKSSQ